jgi:Glyoxalase/Bleomycin resistance protein/Dioxygenase superfamily
MSMKFGPILQNGYVVRDWRRAAEWWSDVMGVGPFFVMEHLEFRRCEFRGQPATIDMSVAIAYSGEHQIELVQQHNDAPSIYTEFLAGSPEGLQHVGVMVDDLAGTLARLGWADRVVQQGETVVGQRFAYCDLRGAGAGPAGAPYAGHEGAMIELIEVNDTARSAFEYMKKTAREWTGERPIRLPKPKA